MSLTRHETGARSSSNTKSAARNADCLSSRRLFLIWSVPGVFCLFIFQPHDYVVCGFKHLITTVGRMHEVNHNLPLGHLQTIKITFGGDWQQMQIALNPDRLYPLQVKPGAALNELIDYLSLSIPEPISRRV